MNLSPADNVELVEIKPADAASLRHERQPGAFQTADLKARLAVEAQGKDIAFNPEKFIPPPGAIKLPKFDESFAQLKREYPGVSTKPVEKKHAEAVTPYPPELPYIKPFARPLRVLQVTSIEVSNHFINNLCDHTDRRVIQYIGLTLGKEGGFTQELDQRGIQGYALDCNERSQYPVAAFKLWQIIERERIDIVHTHLFDPTLLAGLMSRLRDRRHVITRHHGDELYQLPPSLQRNTYLKLEKWMNVQADHLIVPSQMAYDLLVRREDLPAEKVSLIPYGQTMERYEAVQAEQIEKVRAELQMAQRLSLVCVARLHWEKGHRFLLEAFALLRDEGMDANLYLVGNGPDRDMLEQLAEELDIHDRVKFLGWREDALAIMGAADIVVHPALAEAVPSVVIDALMMERPVVATDVSGVRDIVGNSMHGILIPPSNAEALQAALSWTVANLDQAYTRAQAGRQYVASYMDPERVAREYFGVYRKVMKSHLTRKDPSHETLSAETRAFFEDESVA